MGRDKHFVVMFVGAPLWVRNGHSGTFAQCPLFPRKGTLTGVPYCRLKLSKSL
jgi:hypothetical protein